MKTITVHEFNPLAMEDRSLELINVRFYGGIDGDTLRKWMTWDRGVGAFDEEKLVGIGLYCFLSNLNIQEINKRIDKKSDHLEFISEGSGPVIGHLEDLVVDENYRRLGIATEITKTVIRNLCLLGADSFFAITRNGDPPYSSKPLLEKIGMKKIACFTGYNDDGCVVCGKECVCETLFYYREDMDGILEALS